MADSSNPVFRIYFIEAMNFLYDMRFHVSLLKLINDQNKSVRIYAINCIEKNRIIDALHLLRNRALTDENDEVKIAAIKTLGNFMDSKSLYVLLRTVSDNNREIRFATVKALYAIGSRKSAQSLSLLLLREEDDAIKGLILDTLIKLRSYGDIRALEKILLKDENFRLRVKSAYFFGYTRDNRAVKILLKGLEDPDFRVRAEVCSSLGNYRNSLVLSSLLDIIKADSKRYVRSSALYSIKKMYNKKLLLHLFDQYSIEKDIIFKFMLENVIRGFIKR